MNQGHSDDQITCASYRPTAGIDDLYRIWPDRSVLRIEAGGSWDLPAAEAYAHDVSKAVADLRSISPKLRAIVDRSNGPVFGSDVADLLLATYSRILRPGDRLAIIVESSMTKGNIRRLTDREETKSFLSLSAARTWLLAYG